MKNPRQGCLEGLSLQRLFLRFLYLSDPLLVARMPQRLALAPRWPPPHAARHQFRALFAHLQIFKLLQPVHLPLEQLVPLLWRPLLLLQVHLAAPPGLTLQLSSACPLGAPRFSPLQALSLPGLVAHLFLQLAGQPGCCPHLHVPGHGRPLAPPPALIKHQAR